ncbi:hypothetical protein SLNWT_6860 [Streptomyces albus]|uniref:Uncharacterized protein n=1 Tax=Streptomyces albus (strain ATCC 21838 / DSM 41398 / FERM P-419 / JCM 4703 / NBRC 107858) TaxID=1081613 RepID=A0A0B5F8N0_STRA4|nr:hypothetical protein SLNWT_6860 [Streptomyces albus]AOU81540.1 hypothetical protein SLNHY_6849 [Streptomyces albus]
MATVLHQQPDISHVRPGHENRTVPPGGPATPADQVLDFGASAHEIFQLRAVLQVGLETGPHRECVTALHVLVAPPDGREHAFGVIAGDSARVAHIAIEQLPDLESGPNRDNATSGH